MTPLPEERTSEASLERGHDEKGGWEGRDFVMRGEKRRGARQPKAPGGGLGGD